MGSNHDITSNFMMTVSIIVYTFVDTTACSALELMALRRRGLFDCKKIGDECSGVPACCDPAHCYWENGYSAFKVGSVYLIY